MELEVRIVSDGNLFASTAQTITNTVNCRGVMGKGIALEFKKRYPGMFEDYKVRCDRGEVQPGHPYVYAVHTDPQLRLTPDRSPHGPTLILNFPTKDSWRRPSKIEWIEQGLRNLRDCYHEWGIESIAMPPLGCGNGGLEWHEVGPLMYRHLIEMDIPAEIFAPPGTPEEELSLDWLSEVGQ
ncbi:hypothetical protein BH23CHL2_BH23CHL2_18790 [soil metagenome]